MSRLVSMKSAVHVGDAQRLLLEPGAFDRRAHRLLARERRHAVKRQLAQTREQLALRRRRERRAHLVEADSSVSVNGSRRMSMAKRPERHEERRLARGEVHRGQAVAPLQRVAAPRARARRRAASPRRAGRPGPGRWSAR